MTLCTKVDGRRYGLILIFLLPSSHFPALVTLSPHLFCLIGYDPGVNFFDKAADTSGG